MALPVGNQSNKELELVATLLEKTLKELEETKQEFKELKQKTEEKEQRFVDFANNIVKTLKEKEFQPNIKVNAPSVWIDDNIVNTVKQAIEPKKFWSFTGRELSLLGTTFITIVLLGFSIYYNFTSSRVIVNKTQKIFENQKLLYDIYRQETKFWYSKEHQKAFVNSVQNGELEKNISEDKKSFQEKLKNDRETNKNKDKLGK